MEKCHSRTRVMSSPPSPKPREKSRHAQDVGISTPCPPDTQDASLQKLGWKAVFGKGPQHCYPVDSRSNKDPDAGLSTPKKPPSPQRRNNMASTSPKPLLPRKEGVSASAVPETFRKSSSLLKMATSGVRLVDTDQLSPVSPQSEYMKCPKMSSTVSGIESSNPQQLGQIAAFNEGPNVPVSQLFSKTRQQAPARNGQPAIMKSQGDANNMEDIRATTSGPALYPFSTKIRQRPNSGHCGMLASDSSFQVSQSSLLTPKQSKGLRTQHVSHQQSRLTDTLTPNLSSPMLPYSNQPKLVGHHISSRCVHSTTSHRQVVQSLPGQRKPNRRPMTKPPEAGANASVADFGGLISNITSPNPQCVNSLTGNFLQSFQDRPQAQALKSSPVYKDIEQTRTPSKGLSAVGPPPTPYQKAYQKSTSVTLAANTVPRHTFTVSQALSSQHFQHKPNSDAYFPSSQLTKTPKYSQAQSSVLSRRVTQLPMSQSQNSDLTPPGAGMGYTPPGAGMGYPGSEASLTTQELSSSTSSNLNQLPPMPSLPDGQGAERGLDRAHRTHQLPHYILPNYHRQGKTFVPVLPPNLYPSFSRGEQKRKQEVKESPAPNVQNKKLKAYQDGSADSLLNNPSAPGHAALNFTGKNITTEQHFELNQREDDIIRSIKSHTDIHGEKQSIVIAISGFTSSAKTTLAHLLTAVFSVGCSQSGERTKIDAAKNIGSTHVQLIKQGDFLLPARECPGVSWAETFPYTRPTPYGPGVAIKGYLKTRVEEYWELAFKANIGIDPKLIPSNPYRTERHRSSCSIPCTTNRRSPNRDCRRSINWGQLSEQVAVAARKTSTSEAESFAESFAERETHCHIPEQCLKMINPAFLDALRSRVRLFILNQTQQNLEAQFDGRLVVSGRLKDIVLLDGSMLYVLCEGAATVMNMCDSRLFLPISTEAAREQQLNKFADIEENELKPWQTEGYFDYVSWSEYKREHSWLYSSGNPEDSAIGISQICLDKNIFVCPKMDENLNNTVLWAVQMILVSVAMAEQRARLAFGKPNNIARADTLFTGAAHLSLSKNGSSTQGAGHGSDELTHKNPQLSHDWMNLQQELKSYTYIERETADGQASTILQPSELPDTDAWTEEFVNFN